ncbi:GNAT family N-acetyltransferase [Actinoallomurus rhizosphaericola]|uniref:GNAT family N-acetyltransferase n=1 Tax=Actinoallomurus rhizosphaericola TaxID=2952536 RepID=UPI0020915764|nr:GNAT family N-acetyltransferase [Actinoallomurus rhizosphaericola]MCO5992576.1 GNAT family N-acetyltransferase [Actinoallomurus rhizosphaericola]
MLSTPRLFLQTATLLDLNIAAAAASDPEAQRWLGWPPGGVILEDHRDRLLARRPGQGRPFRGPDDDVELVAIDRQSGLLAGSIGVRGAEGGEWEVGGYLAPRFRHQGLGTELFAGAAAFAHEHLGLAVVHAGAEVSNSASIGALLSAGFVPMAGPEHHELPDGRVIPSRWFRHESDRPATCAIAGSR